MTNELINTEYIFLKMGLYQQLSFDWTDDENLSYIFNENEDIQFDCFCIECEEESTFKLSSKINTVYYVKFDVEQLNNYKTPFQYEFTCQRNHSHKYSYIFRITDYKIEKVGQYPSTASIEINSIKKYRRILKDNYQEFSKAIGLYSHGIGIGSFVYLRRIFENLIEESHQLALQEISIDKELYQQSRMDEKIELLSNYLPNILVENKKLYAILSKGIHELSEDECLEIIPKVKLAIELILDEKLAEKEKASKVQQLRKFISSTVETLK
ncbi:short-chain dehydrogenase [Oceanobacillus salinisoli]|uniref:short-chain dehydrogenase n=1 Tax=Oceanobacillus salinisoli TaxID=2678611 RepID=UPI0012E2BFBE|nr:short-chain dehydrogenase [Oceanobacillus salinisoli]